MSCVLCRNANVKDDQTKISKIDFLFDTAKEDVGDGHVVPVGDTSGQALDGVDATFTNGLAVHVEPIGLAVEQVPQANEAPMTGDELFAVSTFTVVEVDFGSWW